MPENTRLDIMIKLSSVNTLSKLAISKYCLKLMQRPT